MQTDTPVLPSALPSEWQACFGSFLHSIYQRSHSSKSLRMYTLILTQFFQAGIHPESATRADVERYVQSPCHSHGNQGGPPSDSTYNVRLCVLASCYAYAAGYFNRPLPNPTSGIRYVKRPRAASHAQNRAFTEEELRRFFAAIPSNTLLGLRDHAIFQVYFWTGKRREEIARLRYGDIEPCMFSENGGQRRGWRYRYSGKGQGGQAHYAELPAPAKAAIDRYLEASGRQATIAATDPLFLAVGPKQGGGRRSAGKPLHSDTVVHALKKYVAAAGLDVTRFSIHSLRHTAAQQRYLMKPDILLLNQFLDHASLDTTRVYLAGLLTEADPLADEMSKRLSFLS